MGNYSNFYSGADYGLDPNYGSEFLGFQYRAPASTISLATDVRTANQLQETSNKLNTGAKAIEISAISPEIIDSIPKEHFKELARLKKMTGVDFTFHAPIVEPTGINVQEQHWDETKRIRSERQMWSAVERAQQLDPNGNLVITFHSSASLPETETIVKNEKGEPVKTSMFFIDQRTGNFGQANIQKHYFPGEEKKSIEEEMKSKTEESWDRGLQQVGYNLHAGGQNALELLKPLKVNNGGKTEEIASSELLGYYKAYGTDEFKKEMSELPEEAKAEIKNRINALTGSHLYIREAYNQLKDHFDMAYGAAQRNKNSNDDKIRREGEEDFKKLERYKEEIAHKVGYLNDAEMIPELVNTIQEGVNILRSVNKPQQFTPLRDFALDKASDTFSNVALNAYSKFKDNAPIISIENPPAGMGFSRAEDLRDIITQSRAKLAKKLMDDKELSKKEAEAQASKLIGATWDVGHINMIKKFGYNDDDLINQTKIVSPYIKNIHLSDNFGMEHTELPMGMGNVPIKRHMEILKQYQDTVKKVIETGNWYQHFKTPPFGETLSAFGSPIYSGGGGQTWNQAYGMTGAAYFAGVGMNPEVHHSYFGSGFSNLPVELGGQIPGKASRFSGAPMD